MNFRLHAGLLLELYGHGVSHFVRLSPDLALGIASALLHDARAIVAQRPTQPTGGGAV